MQNLQIFERKSALLGVVMACMLGILAAPVIVPHLFHGFHLAHIMIHVGGITMAAFLTVLGVIAYSKSRTKRMGITCLGFFAFVAAESVTLVDATWPFMYTVGSMSLIEIGHVLLLAAFGILSIGVFRND